MQEKPTFTYEKRVCRRGFRFIAGADEVGRGALAGPVVAGAVVWEKGQISNFEFLISNEGVEINDSKKLNHAQRQRADLWIKKNCLSWGIGEASVSFIDKKGIVRATRCAFRRAIAACGRSLESRIKNEGSGGKIHNSLFKIQFLLVDAFYVPYVAGLRRKNQLAIVRGDQKSISIAAASIIAKVYRDNLMSSLARPGLADSRYGWERNMGYGTRGHQEAIRRWGPTRLHRKLFVRKLLGK